MNTYGCWDQVVKSLSSLKQVSSLKHMNVINTSGRAGPQMRPDSVGFRINHSGGYRKEKKSMKP